MNKAKNEDGSRGLLVIGIFLGIFALSILVAIFFTDTVHGRITNLISGLTILFIAAIFFVRSRKVRG